MGDSEKVKDEKKNFHYEILEMLLQRESTRFGTA